ncbi:hypothetical protein GCM10010219_66110 [Streptomyces netropsis]|nr:hypothetical protein GCM10010219_66110 [Streptomyces netropsis]
MPFGRSVACRCAPVARSHAYSSKVPVTFDVNSDRSGASSAHLGSPTRGARKRLSQSGMDPSARMDPSPRWGPLLSVMPPILRRTGDNVPVSAAACG